MSIVIINAHTERYDIHFDFLGPLLGYSVIDAHVSLRDFVAGSRTSPPIIIACVAQCLHIAMKEANPALMEPYMELKVSLTYFISEIFMGQMFMTNIEWLKARFWT